MIGNAGCAVCCGLNPNPPPVIQQSAVTFGGAVTVQPGSFADGYREGREDVLFALARGHAWALAALEAERAKVT
jgi:hypothetical protein